MLVARAKRVGRLPAVADAEVRTRPRLRPGGRRRRIAIEQLFEDRACFVASSQTRIDHARDRSRRRGCRRRRGERAPTHPRIRAESPDARSALPSLASSSGESLCSLRPARSRSTACEISAGCEQYASPRWCARRRSPVARAESPGMPTEPPCERPSSKAVSAVLNRSFKRRGAWDRRPQSRRSATSCRRCSRAIAGVPPPHSRRHARRSRLLRRHDLERPLHGIGAGIAIDAILQFDGVGGHVVQLGVGQVDIAQSPCTILWAAPSPASADASSASKYSGRSRDGGRTSD